MKHSRLSKISLRTGYNVLIADEAIEDIFGLVKYIYVKLCNPNAAEKLYGNLYREISSLGDFPRKFFDTGILYRGYVIHKKAYGSYLIFYIISEEEKKVYVLRVIKDLMNWQAILSKARIYHFSKCSELC